MIACGVKAVFCGEGRAEARVDSSVALDDDSIDEKAQYHATIGKWKRATLSLTRDAKFRLIIGLVNPAHKVFEHLQFS